MKKLPNSLIKLTKLLSDGQFHNGDELGKHLGISRVAIWKAVQKLLAYEINILTEKGKGYALQESLILLDKTRIKKMVKSNSNFPFELNVFASLTSTNDYLLNNRTHLYKINFCFAETLTQGRGRLNRSWYSPFGKNIYCSCRYPLDKDISQLSGLSLACSLAIFKTLSQCGVENDLQVQWPNNVLWRQRKIAGCLIDVNAEANGRCHVVIGIGINVNMQQAPGNFPWSSMSQAVEKTLDRNEVSAKLIQNLLEYLKIFETQGFEAFRADWLDHDCLIGRLVQVAHNSNHVCGQAVDINEYGQLILQLPDQSLRTCTSGDTKLL